MSNTATTPAASLCNFIRALVDAKPRRGRISYSDCGAFEAQIAGKGIVVFGEPATRHAAEEYAAEVDGYSRSVQGGISVTVVDVDPDEPDSDWMMRIGPERRRG